MTFVWHNQLRRRADNEWAAAAVAAVIPTNTMSIIGPTTMAIIIVATVSMATAQMSTVTVVAPSVRYRAPMRAMNR